MNPVEIEDAVHQLASSPFNPDEFPFAFLAAFGNKATTIKRLRKTSNHSDRSGLLQRNNIHLKVCAKGETTQTLAQLRDSPATKKHKAQFLLATDGDELQAENCHSGDTLACPYRDFANRFGFFLPLAGIRPAKQITENPIDIRATGRLNKLYLEILKTNPEWANMRPQMNLFMTRLIFCFYAEDTWIFPDGLFTETLGEMSAPDSSDTHSVMAQIFRALATPQEQRSHLPRWVAAFPWVNGWLFEPNPQVPRLNRMARNYLHHIGALDWKNINPDIFGSMIQGIVAKVAKEERAVERAVSPVLQRFSAEVKTGGLFALAALEEQHCKTMRAAYRRCSELMHDQPEEASPRTPTPEEIEQEITTLEDWVNCIDNAQHRRKKCRARQDTPDTP